MLNMGTHERTKLYVDGVDAAITAQVARRRIDGLVVAQPLPFLRLDTRVVDHDGRPARISRVAIAMDGDVPRLLLELSNEEPDPIAELVDGPLDDDDTIDTFVPGVSRRPERRDNTVPYELATEDKAEPPRLVSEPIEAVGEPSLDRAIEAPVEVTEAPPRVGFWARMASRLMRVLSGWWRSPLALRG